MGRAAPDEIESLERLKADEAALDRALEVARRDAEATLSQARAEAGQLAAAAAARLEEEVAARREEAGRALAEIEAGVQRESARRLDELRRRAEANREQAAAAVARRVLGAGA